MRFAFKGWVVGLAVGLLALVEGAAGQNFAQPKVIATGNWPAAVYAADVNGDGIPDLIYIDQGATVTASTTHVLLGDGKGNFTHSATIATAGASVAIGDLTGDGIVDIGWLTWTGATAGLNTFLNMPEAPDRDLSSDANDFVRALFRGSRIPTEVHVSAGGTDQRSGPPLGSAGSRKRKHLV